MWRGSLVVVSGLLPFLSQLILSHYRHVPSTGLSSCRHSSWGSPVAWQAALGSFPGKPSWHLPEEDASPGGREVCLALPDVPFGGNLNILLHDFLHLFPPPSVNPLPKFICLHTPADHPKKSKKIECLKDQCSTCKNTTAISQGLQELH